MLYGEVCQWASEGAERTQTRFSSGNPKIRVRPKVVVFLRFWLWRWKSRNIFDHWSNRTTHVTILPCFFELTFALAAAQMSSGVSLEWKFVSNMLWIFDEYALDSCFCTWWVDLTVCLRTMVVLHTIPGKADVWFMVVVSWICVEYASNMRRICVEIRLKSASYHTTLPSPFHRTTTQTFGRHTKSAGKSWRVRLGVCWICSEYVVNMCRICDEYAMNMRWNQGGGSVIVL